MNSTLTLNSIRFKPPLSKEAYIHITVQVNLYHYTRPVQLNMRLLNYVTAKSKRHVFIQRFYL